MGFPSTIGAFLTPLIFARKTFRYMNTNHLTALGAGPPLLFISYKLSYAKFSYSLEIVDHAHAVLGSIALIQMV